MSEEKFINHLFDDILYDIKWYKKLYYKVKRVFSNFKYSFKKLYQKLKYGFPLEQAWNFNTHCAKYVVPRLKQLRSFDESHPSSLGSVEEWHKILDKIIWSFENLYNDPEPIYPQNYDKRWLVKKLDNGYKVYSSADKRPISFTPIKEHNKKVQEGLMLFAQYYQDLWY